MRRSSFKIFFLPICIVVPFLLLCNCGSQKLPDSRQQLSGTLSLPQDDVVVAQYKSKIDNPQDSLFGVSATSVSSLAAGRIGDNLVIQDADEAIVVSFGQTGRDRNISLALYYDYISVPFRVGTQNEFCNNYNFEIENNANWQIPIYLDSQIIADTITHRIIFVFTLSCDEYAKDKDKVSFNTAVTQMYQLHYNSYKEDAEYTNTGSAYVDNCQYFSYSNVPLMLNTDVSNLYDADFNGLAFADKLYVVSDSQSFDLNCIITNIEQPVKTALFFLTVGHSAAKINGQDYILIDLDKSPMTVCGISVELPSEYGIYDVIGYVVYDPFAPMSNSDTAFPKSSNRFTIEVKK